jgi:hypothetical protein
MAENGDNPGPLSLSASEALGLLTLHSKVPVDSMDPEALGAVGRMHAELWLIMEDARTLQAGADEATGNGGTPKRKPRSSVLTPRS